MAASTPSRLGANNLGGDKLNLFLKVFGGEVLTTFREKTVALNRHVVRTISSGKSAQFPATGQATASYHTPGAELTGQDIKHSERVITIDDMLVADAFVAEIDEAMNHYEVRGEYSYQLGAALAKTFDKNVLRVMGIAARTGATITGGNGGSTINDADADTAADSLAGSIFDAATKLDEKDVPDSDRFCFVKPATYYMLVQSSSKAIHKDYGGEGSYAAGQIIRIAGIPIVPTNNLPDADESADATIDADYRDDFSTTVALVTHRSAAGTVKLRDLSVRADYDPRRLGTLMVAKYLMGHGVLRPESAVEIRTSTPINASA